jgi:hypothetical protein
MQPEAAARAESRDCSRDRAAATPTGDSAAAMVTTTALKTKTTTTTSGLFGDVHCLIAANATNGSRCRRRHCRSRRAPSRAAIRSGDPRCLRECGCVCEIEIIQFVFWKAKIMMESEGQ